MKYHDNLECLQLTLKMRHSKSITFTRYCFWLTEIYFSSFPRNIDYIFTVLRRVLLGNLSSDNYISTQRGRWRRISLTWCWCWGICSSRFSFPSYMRTGREVYNGDSAVNSITKLQTTRVFEGPPAFSIDYRRWLCLGSIATTFLFQWSYAAWGITSADMRYVRSISAPWLSWDRLCRWILI